jgi:hypothetical protein
MEIWMRSFLINKNLSLYYLLKRKFGKKQGLVVASTIEKALLIFGREKIPVLKKNGMAAEEQKME